jgi:hypothetical protein
MYSDFGVRAGAISPVALRAGAARPFYDRFGVPMSGPPPANQNSETEWSEAGSSGGESRCHICGGRLDLLVHVEPQTNGRPVTYYACERCDQVLVRKS